MYRYGRLAVVLAVLVGHSSVAQAQQTISFNTDPFAGSAALTTPGRQIVGGELLTSFNPATDVFSFHAGVFGLYGITGINFVNGAISAVPTSGVNAIVLQTFTPTPFAAGNAAGLIADQVTLPGAGVFLYFNSGLDVPRLVFSTDLSDPTADLKVLARLTNLSGQSGRDAFSQFTAANFRITSTTVPEPSSILLVAAGMLGISAYRRVRKRHAR